MQVLPHNGANLAYRFQPGAGPLIVFLPGYMSDMTGSKAEHLAAWAAARGQACLRLDYSGCGASSGDFLAGCIGRWVDDARAVIDHVWPGQKVLPVGSSMGGWIALLLGERLGQRLAGLLGIAAAPDFTDWGLHLTKADRVALARDGYISRPSDYGADGYRYSAALLADAPGWRVLDRPIRIDAPVRLLQSQCDAAVPWALALDIAGRLHSDDVQVTLLKDGDHRLSRPQDLALLTATLDRLLEQP